MDKVVTLTIKMVNDNLFFRYLSFRRTGQTQKKEQWPFCPTRVFSLVSQTPKGWLWTNPLKVQSQATTRSRRVLTTITLLETKVEKSEVNIVQFCSTFLNSQRSVLPLAMFKHTSRALYWHDLEKPERSWSRLCRSRLSRKCKFRHFSFKGTYI